MKYTVAVRALCEFTAKKGDLDLRFTPAPTAQEGVAGHAVVTGRRKGGYQTEISLAGDYKHLQVRGRADGYDPAKNQLEEIKTYRGDLQRMPDNHRHLHWAQVKIYGHLLCQQRGLRDVKLALVYYDIASQKESVLTEFHTAAELKAYFEQQCECFLAWAAQELHHRSARDRALTDLAFPHAEFRAGQRQLAEAVYRSASKDGACLMAQAPTGIGKTVGTIFPLLKAAPAQSIDKLFFLSAKTPGRQLALDALHKIRQGPHIEDADTRRETPLRVLELVAREKACEHPDKACHGESCPLAKGFYDRLAAARQSAVAACGAQLLDQQTLRTIAREHAVCPYYLSQDLARWADVIVGDYNYYFDISAMLYSLAQLNQWRAAVLVDEAHNLLERGRKMYSAELDQLGFAAVRKDAPAPLKKLMDAVQRQWVLLAREQQADYQVYAAIPEKFLFALHKLSAAIGDYMSEHASDPAASAGGNLLHFYFDTLLFLELAEAFGEHSLFDLSKQEGRNGRDYATLCIRNVLPAPFLGGRFAAAQSTVLFSATLSPWNFYADTLGLPADTPWMEVESPFKAEQLAVKIAGKVSTRYQHREASLAPIAELIGQQYLQQPGNYLAFFSSFDYLAQAIAAFRQRHPDIPVWEQSRGMDEGARAEFLARFSADGEGIGFAVLGGAFAEGIDLPGRRLIGAFIATLGLPQLNPVNEQMRERLDAIFGRGYDYAYLYPGLQKVVQAAGRVIRTQEDRGVVYLIDDRFGRGEVRALLPKWWKLERV